VHGRWCQIFYRPDALPISNVEALPTGVYSSAIFIEKQHFKHISIELVCTVICKFFKNNRENNWRAIFFLN